MFSCAELSLMWGGMGEELESDMVGDKRSIVLADGKRMDCHFGRVVVRFCREMVLAGRSCKLRLQASQKKQVPASSFVVSILKCCPPVSYPNTTREAGSRRTRERLWLKPLTEWCLVRGTRVVSYRRERLEIGRTERQKARKEGVNVVLLRQCEPKRKSMI